MAKTTVDASKATITIGGAEIGVTDLSFGTEIEELEAFDTKSEDYLGGKTSRPVSFTYSKDVTVAKLALNTSLAVSFVFKDEQSSPKTETISGNIKLFSETFNAGYGGVLTISVVGRFTAAYTDVLT